MPREEDPYLLRGLLTCGHCRGLLQTHPNSGIRYYRCGCHFPNQARKYGKPVCLLPDLHGPDLEAELWRVLDATLLDPDYLTAGLEAARAQHDRADGLRRDRLAVLDDEIARQRQRVDNLTAQLADAGSGEVYASIMRRAKDIEGMIARLAIERAELGAVRAEGLSADEADGIIAFAAEVRHATAVATPADRGRLYETLRVRGMVSRAPADDPDAVPLGRKHRYRIDWAAAIPLRHPNRTDP